ncbi:MAG TPA: DNA gyrase modulator, partial [Allosphingosinicella sp.]|nr:DNA gyrase modulator [Allosphingosinicella sp.]
MTFTADPRRFLYRPDGLDPDAALRLTADALEGCDDGELYLQYTASESFSFDDGRLKSADFNTQAGFGLRGVSGETTAFAQANEISEAAIRRAAETMAVLDPAKGAKPGPPRRTNAKLYTDDDPLGLIPFARKVALCQQIDAAARARDPRVAQVSVALSGSWSVID